VPVWEVPQVKQPEVADDPNLSGLVLDMEQLAKLTGDDLIAALNPLAAYAAWIERRAERSREDDDLWPPMPRPPRRC